MKILTSSQVKEADKYTIEHEPVPSINLMERAAQQITSWILKNYDKNQSFVFFAGPGNNGGDTWAVARQLAGNEYTKIRFYLFDIADNISPDSQVNRGRLEKQGRVEVKSIKAKKDFPPIHRNDIVIDGLFGSGLSRPLEGLPAQLVKYINDAAVKKVIAIDIPSGLYGEESVTDKTRAIIKADITLTFQFPKLSFFMAENESFVGTWEILPIGLHQEFIRTVETPYGYLTADRIRKLLHFRKKFSHKGTFGHGLLMAGSYGMMGAAVLAARAAKHSGIGLVTAHIPKLGYHIMQTAVPEALTSIDISEEEITQYPSLERYSAVAVGPGTGNKPGTKKAIEKLLKDYQGPVVLDADALNIISGDKDLLKKLPNDSVLTPHPGEFNRLFEGSKSAFDRVNNQIKYSQKYGCYIVLKGAYTSISNPQGLQVFNTTGNPGMATGGSGDVLTGMILSLLAQGYPAQSACEIGVYIHGLAGDIAARQSSMEAVTAGDIIENIGNAFNHIRHED